MSFSLEILEPDGVVVTARVSGVRAADASGQFGLWPGHEPFVTALEPCVVTFREETGRERYAAVDAGVLLSEHDLVSIVSREAVVADRLEDVANAAAEMFERRRVAEKSARAEFTELQTSLLRELHKVEKTR